MSTTHVRRREPVTTVLTWRVRPGHEPEFEEWTRGISRCARDFPGNQGVAWLHPADGGHRYHAVLRFSDTDRLGAWLRSDERAAWHERIEGVATEVSSERQSTTGMETWFSLPGTSVQSPPRWKMVLTTFLGAYPFTLLIQWLITPHTTAWPLPLRAAVFPLALLPVLMFLMMPLLSRVLRLWLYPPPDR